MRSSRFTLACLSLLSLIASTAAPGQIAVQRARDIVKRMTLDEKIEQVHGYGDADPVEFEKMNAKILLNVAALGLDIRRYVPAVVRLGIPMLVITNGPAGVGMGNTKPQAPATAFPSPIGIAATWDVNAARRFGEIAGSEAHDIGNSLLEAPTINIARVPQNGRTFEGYGEDPFLTSQLSVAVIQGIQSQRVLANVKHYVANNQETDRATVNEEIDERAMREIYLPAFEASIKVGHSASVMCAYPKINGTFNCENDFLMSGILRKEWGFDGFVSSDFGANHSTIAAALAGLDLELPTGAYFGAPLKKAVESGDVPVAVIDEKLVRRYTKMIEFGLFDNAPAKKTIPAREHGSQSRQMATEAMVLLKNDGGLLPLNPSRLKSIALIGPYAKTAVIGGGGSSQVVPLYSVDPLDGLKKRAGSNITVSFSDGGDVSKASALARAADIAIVMVGSASAEGHDHGLDLEASENQLVQSVSAANPHTIVVLKTDSAVLMPWLDRVPAVLEAWYPGEEDGNAVAEVLFGDANPSGRLPLTFPRSPDDTPAKIQETFPGVNGVVKYSEGVFVGYRHYDRDGIEPLFAFGHGLSYSTFSYAKLKISKTNAEVKSDYSAPYTVELDITNSGKRSGAEVVQVYLGSPSTSAVPQPPEKLAGFARIDLKPGEKHHVSIPLQGHSLAYWDAKSHDWKLAGKSFQLMVGASSRDIRLRGRLDLPQ